MKSRLTWAFFFLLSVGSIVFAILHKEQHLYLTIGLGISYITFAFSYIFSTPFYWMYKVEEAIYVVWMMGITSYLFYEERYILTMLFLIPILFHYSGWAKNQEQKALYFMIIKVRETRDLALMDVLLREVKKRKSSLTSPSFFTALEQLEELLKE